LLLAVVAAVVVQEREREEVVQAVQYSTLHMQ
jgi:hypothetical protein